MSDDKEIFEKLHSGELYVPAQPELLKVQRKYMDIMHEFNALPPSEAEQRTRLCKEMFLEFGEGSFLEGPVYANFGGRHVKIGKDVYANSNLILVDDTYITIKDNTMIAPNVTLATASHPLEPSLRKEGYQFNKPVEIGRNVWIGTGAIVLPGVKIGDNSVIGAGSVVTKDIPPGVLAMGTPCRVVRKIV